MIVVQMSKGLVSKATSDDVKPVTGLQLKNLADATIDIKECDTIREALLSRLEESSPFVKFKRGEGNKLIKDHLGYKGTPHETRGDAPNQSVRDEAKAALAAIFGSGDAPAMSRENIVGFGSAGGGAEPTYGGNGGSGAAPGGGGGAGGAGGYGAGTYGGNVSINVSKSGNMIGFGNPAFENRPESKGIFDTIKDAVVGTTTEAPFKPWQQPGPYAGAGYGPGQLPPSASTTYTPTAINHATQPTNSAAPAGGRKKGQVGGVWEAETTAPVASRPAYADPYQTGGGGGGGGGPYRSAAAAPDVPPARTHTGGGEFERKLVEEIVQPSGVRSFPTPQEMSTFVKKCQSLDSYDIASLLDAKLAATVQAASQLKAVAVLDALLGSESADGVIEFYRAHASDALLLSHENAAAAAMRKAANAVLVKTGLRSAAPTATGPTPQERQLMAAAAEHQASSASNAQATPNLLFEVPATNGTASAPNDSVSSAAGLFRELTVNSSAAAAPAPAPAPAPNNDLGLFFPAPTQQQPVQSAPKPQPTATVTSNDPFSALLQMSNKPSAPAPAPNTSADPFSALYNKPKPAPTQNTNNPYAALAAGLGNGSGSSNPNSNLNFLSNSNKNYNFTVTAAENSTPAAANGNANRSNAIDPFANAFAGPVPTSKPAPATGSSQSSGFGFIATDKSADPFGGLVQLK